jgi:hypothetical protein
MAKILLLSSSPAGNPVWASKESMRQADEARVPVNSVAASSMRGANEEPDRVAFLAVSTLSLAECNLVFPWCMALPVEDPRMAVNGTKDPILKVSTGFYRFNNGRSKPSVALIEHQKDELFDTGKKRELGG